MKMDYRRLLREGWKVGEVVNKDMTRARKSLGGDHNVGGGDVLT